MSPGVRAATSRARSGWVAWALWALLLGAALVQISRTPVQTDISAFLPGPATAAQALVADQLRDGVGARTILIAIEGDTALTLAKASRALAARLAGEDAFVSVLNGDQAAFAVDRDRLFSARYLIAPDTGAEAFTVDALRARFSRLEDMLRGAMGPALRPIAPSDPGLASLAILDRLERARAVSIASRHGVWFGAGAEHAVLLAQTRAGASDLTAAEHAIAVLQRAFASVREQIAAPAVRLRVGGTIALSLRARELIEQDAWRLSALAMTAIIVLLLVALRSLRFVAVAVIPIASGIVAGIAVVGAIYGSVHGVTLGFGITLIGEAIDYAIYANVQRCEDGRHPARFWSLLWLAAGSSAAGFVVMLFSGFRGLEQLGIFSVAGILAAAVCTRWLLPALLPPVPPRTPARVDGALSAIERALRRTRPIWLIGTVLAAGLLAARAGELWNDDLGAISPLPAAALAAERRLREDLGLPEAGLMIVASGRGVEQALQRAETIEPRLRALLAERKIAGFDSPASLLPSQARQRERQRQLPSADVVRARIRDALDGSAFRPQAFEPFVQAVDAARTRAPIEVGYYAGTQLGRRLATQLFTHGGDAAALVTLYGVADPLQLRAALADAPGVQVLDLKGDIEAIVTEYRRRAVNVAVAGALAIVALVAARLGTVAGALRVAAVLPATVVITAAAITLLYNRLTLFNLVALLLVVGIASNYALFFATRPRGETERAAARMSVSLCAMTTFVAFFLLSRSATPVLQMIGSTVACGALLGVLLSMAFSAPAPIDRAGARMCDE